VNRVRKSDEGIEPTRTTDFALGLERAGGEGYAGAMGALVRGRCSLKGGAFGESGAFFSPSSAVSGKNAPIFAVRWVGD